MKAYGDVEIWLHSLLDVGTRWRLLVHVPSALSQEMCPLYVVNMGRVDIITVLDIMEEK
jgi:hypothetical protein